MTQNQINIQYLIARYRYKHKGEKKANEALDRILWYSYPIVYGSHDCKAITRAMESRKAKKKRVNRYLRGMAECYDELHFITLTWRDEYLNTLSESTRQRYVRDYLNANCRDFYANQDFGKRKTEREHYHAVVALKDTTEPWRYGFSNDKTITRADSKTTRTKISSYMLKLTNHAEKLGTGKSFHKRGIKEVDNLPF